MKKVLIFSFISLFLISSHVFAAPSAAREFTASGMIITVDPVYSQVTIRHSAIKDFSGPDDTVFSVADKALLKDLTRYDLVEFHITDNKGDVQIDRLAKTGVASPEDNYPLGRAVQDVLEGTGEVVKGVTTPIAPVHEAASGVVDATTGTTGEALNDADTEHTTKF